MTRTFLALAWVEDDPQSFSPRMELFRRFGASSQWSLAASETGFQLYVRGPCAPSVQPCASGGYVVGDLFGARRSHSARDGHDGLRFGSKRDRLATARALLAETYGRYVALWPVAGRLAVLRDPTGGFEAVTWRRRGLTLVAGDLVEALPAGLGPSARVNWTKLSGELVGAGPRGDDALLEGVEAVAPGGYLPPGGQQIRLWRPQAFAGRAAASISPPEELAARARACVQSYAGDEALVCELSGGFDSSVVAALLSPEQQTRTRLIHFRGRGAEADEVASAQHAADHLGLNLHQLELEGQGYSLRELEALPSGWRPSFAGLDHHLDEAMARAVEVAGAKRILTGQGGDAVFFQAVTPWASRDLTDRNLAEGPAWAWRLAIARSTRRSVWALLAMEFAAKVGFGPNLDPPSAPWIAASARRSARGLGPHPWLRDLRRIAPAKRLHIHALVYAQRYLGPSARSAVADIAHPLLAQPIVEFCLGVPVLDLTDGVRGRAMARRVLGRHLPVQVAWRRSKGDLTSYYGLKLARSLQALRPFLLDGVVCREGLVNRQILETWLNEEALMERGGYGDLLQLMSVEAWARRWA